MATLTLVYTAIARNRSPADLAAALAGIPLDASITTLAGLTLSSDTTAPSGNVVTRTIVYSTGAPPQLIPNANLAETAIGWYGTTFSKALATPVTSAPPVLS
ncbi:MAG: hypothetical protein ACREU5_06890 [Burkholderiales bacterium]